jgi:hypothetical protein
LVLDATTGYVVFDTASFPTIARQRLAFDFVAARIDFAIPLQDIGFRSSR